MNDRELQVLKDAFDLIGGIISDHENPEEKKELTACDMSDLDRMDAEEDAEKDAFGGKTEK